MNLNCRASLNLPAVALRCYFAPNLSAEFLHALTLPSPPIFRVLTIMGDSYCRQPWSCASPCDALQGPQGTHFPDWTECGNSLQWLLKKEYTGWKQLLHFIQPLKRWVLCFLRRKISNLSLSKQNVRNMKLPVCIFTLSKYWKTAKKKDRKKNSSIFFWLLTSVLNVIIVDIPILV